MTGYGESSIVEPQSGTSIRIQLKSVNSRFLDINSKLPVCYNSLDTEVQKKIKLGLKRGRVDVSAFRSALSMDSVTTINQATLSNLVLQLEPLEVHLSKQEVIMSALPALLSRKEVFEGSEVEVISEEEKLNFLACFDEALSAFIQSRVEEGKALERELSLQISNIEKISKQIKAMSIASPPKIKEKFQLRLKELLDSTSLNQERLEQEVAILADRTDIREEIVRLDSHIQLFKDSLPEGGRKLEFIVQELGREINTIGSKSSEVELSTLVIEAKSILEKIREQIQNVE